MNRYIISIIVLLQFIYCKKNDTLKHSNNNNFEKLKYQKTSATMKVLAFSFIPNINVL